MTRTTLALAVSMAIGLAGAAHAGFYKTITIDSDFSDWADVPAVDDDSGDNTAGPDIGVTKIANDDNFLYIYNTFPNGLSLGTFTSIDSDSNTATGFDVFGLGLIGSEAGWQNDFPFTQDAANFNNGFGMSGDFFGSGAALLDAFANGAERELAISLDILFNQDSSAVFPDGSVNLLFWTDLGLGADGLPGGDLAGDVSAPISYTLAAIPEPASVLLFGLGSLALVRRR
ncbi:PEP-CTERM sorting domain-containing protein [Botrimarina hoheduenensis]|uniref:Ice-binding protein C-terminal domain-containing protein n=1 Tax=Botrimarina hoheduenensis TaxID=2528000 RepID=A0A5C5W8H9_9BACT|nr:PEP-CTERM sorting domain-containing protein [Botrimarina hoheduenensis]TWT47198.1 hypothetical protein Pla111_08100 [Botrimarina hoheduenensis]